MNRLDDHLLLHAEVQCLHRAAGAEQGLVGARLLQPWHQMGPGRWVIQVSDRASSITAKLATCFPPTYLPASVPAPAFLPGQSLLLPTPLLCFQAGVGRGISQRPTSPSSPLRGSGQEAQVPESKKTRFYSLLRLRESLSLQGRVWPGPAIPRKEVLRPR